MKSKIINLKKTRSFSGVEKPNGIDILEQLFPEEEHYITQSAEVDILDRVFASQLTLGAGCSSDEWRDISLEEMRILKEKQNKEKKRREEEENKRLEEIAKNGLPYEDIEL